MDCRIPPSAVIDDLRMLFHGDLDDLVKLLFACHLAYRLVAENQALV